ncbi:hypothetical protein [Rhodococcus sp. NPDC058514]|uniref:hypothetical protein n=1 Tax=unclassified Rhodococcus (in: high G+C Gram-positive bacteria) TaxID=192944 RepID=UPI0036530442
MWLPVSVAFGITITAGFGLDAIDAANPATAIFLLIVFIVGTIHGLVIGLVAIVAGKLAGRVIAGPLSSWRRPSKVAVFAMAAGGAVATAVWLYMHFASQRIDGPSVAGPVAFVAVVAGVSAVASEWGRPVRGKSDSIRHARDR